MVDGATGRSEPSELPRVQEKGEDALAHATILNRAITESSVQA